jgi:hypothetical protein
MAMHSLSSVVGGNTHPTSRKLVVPEEEDAVPRTLPDRCESSSFLLVINDTKLLMPCVKYFELGISNTCDEGVCGKEWWPQDHKEMVHGHEMMIMMENTKV